MGLSNCVTQQAMPFKGIILINELGVPVLPSYLDSNRHRHKAHVPDSKKKKTYKALVCWGCFSPPVTKSQVSDKQD